MTNRQDQARRPLAGEGEPMKPSELKRRLQSTLPRQPDVPFVRITPRDQDERRCTARSADHYEVAAYYTDRNPGLLQPLEKALGEVPGVYMTTRIHGWGPPVSNPDWPVAWMRRCRGFGNLAPQVVALMGEPGIQEVPNTEVI
jgi:hypothetical protein